MEAKPDNKTATMDNSSSSSRWPISFKDNVESAKKRGSEEKKQGSKIHAPVHATPYVPATPTSSSQPPENKPLLAREFPATIAPVESIH